MKPEQIELLRNAMAHYSDKCRLLALEKRNGGWHPAVKLAKDEANEAAVLVCTLLGRVLDGSPDLDVFTVAYTG